MRDKFRVFATDRDATDHLATLKGRVYLKRSRGDNPRPGNAAARLAARGVLTEMPVEVIPLKDGTFAVPVPLDVSTRQATAADGSKYTEPVKVLATDPVAVEVDVRAEEKEKVK